MKTRDLMKIINFYARFTPSYTKIGYYGRRLTWGMGPKLDFSGQKWLVTGASLGIGRAIMKAAAEAGAEIAHPPMEIPGHGKFAIFIQGGIHHGLWQR